MRILAIDLGDARTGIAVCDALEMLASPVGTIAEKNPNALFHKICGIVQEQRAQQIVLGYPKNMNDTVGDRAQKAEQFAEKLRGTTGLEVVLWDERSTTVSAHNILNATNTRGKKRKEVVDTVAATIILQSYLDYRRIQKERETQ